MPVDLLFKLAEIEKGSQVADIGCHEGYMTIKLANSVGSDGKVYAVDVRQDRLDRLEDNLENRDLRNVTVILGDFDNPKLPGNQLDAVLIIDTYHEINQYERVLKHVYTSLKSGGRLLVLEKLKSWVRTASRQEQVDAHSLGPKYVRKELIETGFEIREISTDLGNWEEDPDKPIWVILAVKPETD